MNTKNQIDKASKKSVSEPGLFSNGQWTTRKQNAQTSGYNNIAGKQNEYENNLGQSDVFKRVRKVVSETSLLKPKSTITSEKVESRSFGEIEAKLETRSYSLSLKSRSSGSLISAYSTISSRCGDAESISRDKFPVEASCDFKCEYPVYSTLSTVHLPFYIIKFSFKHLR